LEQKKSSFFEVTNTNGKMDEQIKNTDGEDGRGNKKRRWFAGVGCGPRVRRPVIQKKLLSFFFFANYLLFFHTSVLLFIFQKKLLSFFMLPFFEQALLV
jgi:hypothetical protein